MDTAETVLTGFADEYHQKWKVMMLRKLGLTCEHRDDETLLRDLLNWMENNKADFINTFRFLTAMARSAIPQSEDAEWKGWLDRWQKRLTRQPGTPSFVQHIMRQSNPAVIPRKRSPPKSLFLLFTVTHSTHPNSKNIAAHAAAQNIGVSIGLEMGLPVILFSRQSLNC